MNISYSLPVGLLLYGKSYVYKIERVLGQGTFGITYLARTRVKVYGALGEIETDLRVAVKEFFMKDFNTRSDSTVSCSSGDVYADYKRKFAREAMNLSRMKHPHIVKVLELFERNIHIIILWSIAGAVLWMSLLKNITNLMSMKP
jgi:serine/threonine protein kinase